MRKFLAGFCLSLFSLLALAADDLPLVAGLKAIEAPIKVIARETAKGKQADFDALGKAIVETDAAWKTAMADALDVERYGVPAAQHDEVRRTVRLMDMLVGYAGDAWKRGDHGLVLRAAERLPEPYAKLAAALGLR